MLGYDVLIIFSDCFYFYCGGGYYYCCVLEDQLDNLLRGKFEYDLRFIYFIEQLNRLLEIYDCSLRMFYSLDMELGRIRLGLKVYIMRLNVFGQNEVK